MFRNHSIARTRLAAHACALFMLPVCAQPCRATPSLNKQDLYEGELGGNKLYRIPGIVVTAKGTLLAYCEARRDASADYGEISVSMRRSPDGGKTWEKPRQIAHAGPRIEGNPRDLVAGAKDQTVNNPVAIAGRDGRVHFLYCVNYEHAFYMSSDDDGVMWSPPVEITKTFDAFRPEIAWQVIATGPGHGIQLKSGRLVVPVWIAFGERGKHGPSCTATIYSDDNGETWQRGAVAMPNTDVQSNPGEPAIVELSDGRVMMNARNNSDASRRLVSVSPDGISSWSPPRFDDALWEPKCAAGLTRVPSAPRTLVFSNPHNLKRDEDGKPIPGGQAKRRNLSIKVSRDDGQTWTSNRTLEEGTSAYSDLIAMPDGSIVCFYERDLRLTVARFNLDWALANDARD